MLEPYAGYHSGKIRYQNSTEGQSGFTYGGRLGLQRLGLMAGVDYMTGSWRQDEDPKGDDTPTDIGAFVGYEFPVMLRVYGVYVFDSKLKAKYDNTADPTDEYKGTAMKAGVGFTSFPFVVVNIEYIVSTFTELDGVKITNGNVKTEMIGATLSLPLKF